VIRFPPSWHGILLQREMKRKSKRSVPSNGSTVFLAKRNRTLDCVLQLPPQIAGLMDLVYQNTSVNGYLLADDPHPVVLDWKCSRELRAACAKLRVPFDPCAGYLYVLGAAEGLLSVSGLSLMTRNLRSVLAAISEMKELARAALGEWLPGLVFEEF
jgi:hypothetical protein